MFHIERSITILKRPEVVFEYVANPEHFAQWCPDVLETHCESTSLHRGTTFEERIHFIGTKSFVFEVVDFVPDRKLVIKGKGVASFTPTETMVFQPHLGYTELTVRVEFQTSGFHKLVEPVYPGVFERKWEDSLAMLKEIIETNDVPVTV